MRNHGYSISGCARLDCTCDGKWWLDTYAYTCR